MDILRKGFDCFYDVVKPIIFKATAKDPERAHELFISLCRGLHKTRLEKLVLDNKTNHNNLSYKISNAAGFNKNAEISPTVLKYLGFDRVVIGTVTNDSWGGNPRPRTKRYVKTGSLVNWMGLPGIGAERIAERLFEYGDHKIPLTINLMSTPGKKGDELLRDLKGTILTLKDLPYVDRFELNISCPNTFSSIGVLDARQKYVDQLFDMLEVVLEDVNLGQDLYLKISPDADEREVDEILEICNHYRVCGFTLTNTTTNHRPEYIYDSPGKGGASGNAVYDDSLRVQKLFAERISEDVRLIACGGINSVDRLKERGSFGNVKEIQVYTPLIFSGTSLLRKLRSAGI